MVVTVKTKQGIELLASACGEIEQVLFALANDVIDLRPLHNTSHRHALFPH